MSVTRERRIKRLFVAALEAPDRQAYLDTLHAETREEVEALLEAESSMGDFMDESALHRLRRPLDEGAAVGAYTIVRVIGAGGTGTVYEAIQAQPRRKVALKVMHAPRRGVQEEAEILARLKHPGIAHVYEAGEHDGLPFFALEFIEGARTIREHAGDLEPRERLALVAHVCDAVHHGHQKGVIHRDLKPGNVLVDESGRAKVIDFGIARSVGDPGRSEIAGTPPYMAPEQFGEHADVRSDVYALGVLLYEVLTGRLPFDVAKATISEATRIIRDEAPAPLGRAWRGDVEAIVGKALAKEPEARYPSAAGLASDIRRHLGHWPVEARRAGLLYQLGKFARRQRAAFVSLAGVVAISIAAALIGGNLAVAREHERRAAEYQAYLASIAAASAALRLNDVAEARVHLEQAPVALRGWEWRHLYGRLDMSTRQWKGLGGLQAAAVSGDRSRIAAAARDRSVRVWEAASGRLLHEAGRGNVESLAFSPDGKTLVLGFYRGPVEIRDAATGALEKALPEAHAANVTMVDFAPDGRLFATSSYDGTVKLWEAASGRCVRTLAVEGRVFSLAFDPRGGRLVTGGGETDPTIRVWDIATGQAVRTIEGHESNVEDVAFSPDGSRLASVSTDQTVRLWDATTWESLAVRRGHLAGIKDVAFAPDGKTFATAALDRTVRLWSAEDGAELACLKGHADFVYAVVYVADGEIASFSMDETVRFWRTEADEIPTLRHRGRDLSYLEFSPDGRRLVSADTEEGIQLWDPDGRRELKSVRLGAGEALVIDDPEFGGRLYAMRSEAAIRATFLEDGDAAPPFPVREVVQAQGRLFLTRKGVDVEVYDGERRVALFETGRVLHLATDPGRRFVAAAADGAVHVWEARSLAPLARIEVREQPTGVAISPDGRRIALATATGLSLWDPRRNERLSDLSHGGGVYGIPAFSPDGKRLASGGSDGRVRLWDPETGRLVLVLHGHSIYTYYLAWSPDGRRLASAGGAWFPEGVRIRLWDA